MKKRVIFLIILGLAIIGGAIGYYQYNRENDLMSEVKPDVTINATDLAAAFSQDEAAATQQYQDKNLAVTGKLVNVEKTPGGATNLVLFGSEMSNVVCEVDKRYEGELPAAGQTITVQGVCTGYLMDVVLVRCIPVEK